MQALGALLPLISTVASLGGSIYQSVSGQQQAGKARKRARALEASRQQFWKEHAYRSPEQIEALRKQGASEIETARAAGQERLTQAIGPARGWGRGSGVLGSAMRELEAAKLRNLAGLETRMTELATTPMWPYSPSGAFESAAMQPGGGYGGMATGLSDAFSRAMGYMNTMWGGGGGTNTGSYNWGNLMQDYPYTFNYPNVF